MCITKALIILGYMELPEEDQPDDTIWNHQELLDEHWEKVKERRNNPGHEKVPDEWENVDLEQNELTKQYRSNLA